MRVAGGFTLIELLIVVAIVGILASVGMAVYRHARVRGAEVAAIAALTAINQAQLAFAQACGNQRYAPTLVSLGLPMPSTGHAFLSPDLTLSDPLLQGGYQYVMTGTEVTDTGLTCTQQTPIASYVLTADPIRPGLSGTRWYGTNTDRVVFEDTTTFVGNMPETAARVMRPISSLPTAASGRSRLTWQGPTARR